MAKRIVKRKRKRNYNGVIYTILMFTVLFFLVVQVFGRTENTRIMKSIQDLDRKVAQSKITNEVILGEIQDLSSYSRVVSIAHEAGLETNNNTVTIKQGD